MAVRTGAQLKSDMAAIATALDTTIATPNQTNANALITACNTVIQNSRDSMPSILESATPGIASHSAAGRQPSIEYEQLADAVKKEALHVQSKGSLTDATMWRKVKRTLISNGTWPHMVIRPTTT